MNGGCGSRCFTMTDFCTGRFPRTRCSFAHGVSTSSRSSLWLTMSSAVMLRRAFLKFFLEVATNFNGSSQVKTTSSANSTSSSSTTRPKLWPAATQSEAEMMLIDPRFLKILTLILIPVLSIAWIRRRRKLRALRGKAYWRGARTGNRSGNLPTVPSLPNDFDAGMAESLGTALPKVPEASSFVDFSADLQGILPNPPAGSEPQDLLNLDLRQIH